MLVSRRLLIAITLSFVVFALDARTQSSAGRASVKLEVFAGLLDSLGNGPHLLLASRTTGSEPLSGLAPLDSVQVDRRISAWQAALNVPHALVRTLLDQNPTRMPVAESWFPKGRVHLLTDSEVVRLEREGNAVFEVSLPIISADGRIALVYAAWNRGMFGAPEQMGQARVYRLDRDGERFRVTRSALGSMK